MSLVIKDLAVPLRLDEHGRVRIGGTRVTLDSVVYAFQRGETPEQVAYSFDTLSLADIYATMTYYLQHKAEVDAYLQERERQAEEIRRENEAGLFFAGMRERLLSRRKETA